MPCGECKKRGIPDECVYYEPKKRGPKMKTAEEEAQSKEEAKKRKVSKKNEVPSATVVDLERTNLLQSNSQIIASSSSNAATTTPVIPALFSRKEIDRRNYILHMIFPEANLPNDIKENCPDDSFNEMFRLFLSDEFVSFLVECMDGNKSKNQLMPFIREKVLLSILNRIMEPYYHGMYFSLESLFLKYYCLFKLSPHDDNRPILLLESEKSVKQNKKDFNIITNDIQTIICNLWSSFFNTILEFKSVNSSYNQLVIKNMLDLIVNKLSENVDIQSVLELQHALFTRYLLLIEIHQQIEGCTTNSVQFKKLVFNFLKLTYLSGITTKSAKLVDQFEKFNTKFFAILTSQYSSMSLNTNYVMAEMECFIPRNLTECLTFLSVITSEGEQDLEVLFLEYMSKLLNLSIYMQGILNTNDKNLQEMNASVGKDFFHIAKNLKSPIILSILNSLQNYLITSFFENTISIPESPQLENQFKERILTSASQFEHQDHFYLRASNSLIRGKDLSEMWKESKKVFIK